jgi:hypothetical protein
MFSSRLEQQEKKVIADIKMMAKKGQMVCVLIIYLYLIQHPGRSKSDGERSSPHTSIREEVHDDASKYTGCIVEDTNTQVTRLDGTGDEGSHECHEVDE